mgnify:CR=1 FL=1
MLTRTCIQCNKEFTMTESEIRFYKSKRLSLPKRCKDCRDANKKIKAENGGQLPKSEIKTNAAASVENAAPQEKGKMGILPLAIGAVAVIVVVIVVIALL